MQSQAWELVMDSSEVHPGIKAETAENLAVLHLVADHDREAARFLLTARKVGCHRPHSLPPACLAQQTSFPAEGGPCSLSEHRSPQSQRAASNVQYVSAGKRGIC